MKHETMMQRGARIANKKSGERATHKRIKDLESRLTRVTAERDDVVVALIKIWVAWSKVEDSQDILEIVGNAIERVMSITEGEFEKISDSITKSIKRKSIKSYHEITIDDYFAALSRIEEGKR